MEEEKLLDQVSDKIEFFSYPSSTWYVYISFMGKSSIKLRSNICMGSQVQLGNQKIRGHSVMSGGFYLNQPLTRSKADSKRDS